MKDKDLKLSSCPFCGGKAELKKCHHRKNYYVICSKCGAETSRDYLFTISAANAWNTRREGKWISDESKLDMAHCSECMFNISINAIESYCPNCGAYMIE